MPVSKAYVKIDPAHSSDDERYVELYTSMLLPLRAENLWHSTEDLLSSYETAEKHVRMLERITAIVNRN